VRWDHLDIDWKILVFALFGCYFLPWVVAGLVVSTIFEHGEGQLNHAPIGWVFIVSTVVCPILAGYFTAKLANNRPLLHVVLIAILGPLLQTLFSSRSVGVYAAYMVMTALCCAFGAFVALRSGARRS
jgi:hypothetical protein